MLTRIIKQTSIPILILAIISAIILVAIPTMAAKEDALRSDIDQVEADIAENEKILDDLEDQVQSLENRITQLGTEIEIATEQIELTTLKIKKLKRDIKKTQAELEQRKQILSESVKTLYKRGESTTFELLITSDSYSEFIDEQEYLSRLKQAVQESAEKVRELRDELESQKQDQEDLLAKQEAQYTVLSQKRGEQRQLLANTKGEEARYQEILADLQKQRQQAQTALEDFLAAQNYVSLGYVEAGVNIGLVGSSGFSTGPHLHFAIYENGTFLDPGGSGGVLNYGYKWPLPNSSGDDISQGFGCVAPPGWYVTTCNGGRNSYHTGLDISGWYGDPVRSAGAGDIIFRGVLGGYGNTVIIDHGNGQFTYYPHLLE